MPKQSMSQKFKSFIGDNGSRLIWGYVETSCTRPELTENGIEIKTLHYLPSRSIEFVDGSIYRHPHWSM